MPKSKKHFPFPQKKITKIDKDGDESVLTIFYKIKFIGSARFIASSLPNLVKILVGIDEIKCKDCDYFLE